MDTNRLIAIEEGTADVLRDGRRIASLGEGDLITSGIPDPADHE